MKIRRLLPVVAFLPILAALAAAPAHADDFGCKVLLCILNPQGWSSVGACVPPVEQAFRMVARGKPWPQCPEAGSQGRIGYEKFKDCPEGTIPVTPVETGEGSGNSGRVGYTSYRQDRDGAFCAPPRLADGYYGSRNASSVTPRELRTEPNYLDLTTSDGTQRYWFNLRSYQ